MKRSLVTAGWLLLVVLFSMSGAAAPEYVRPLEGRTFALDAGSGGEADESGQQGKSLPADVLKNEREANLYVALFLKEMLEIAGAKTVVLSAITAAGKPNINEKMKTARSAGASCLISINRSFAKNPALNFASVYCYPQYKEPESTLGLRISKAIADDLGIQDRGVRAFGFQVLREATVPMIMVCPSCLTNADAQKRLKNIDYSRKEALAILKGIVAYYAPSPSEGVPTRQQEVPRISPTPAPAAQRIVGKPIPYAPQLLNPVNHIIDQTWLFGEKWGNLPVKYGLSFMAPKGTEVVAAGNGAVIAADSSGATSDMCPYPHHVIIRHDDTINGKEVYTVYGQMETIAVMPGQRVQKGQKIGTTDAPFADAGLRSREFEFEVRLGGNSRAYVRNPELFINHVFPETGIIVGRMARENEDLLSGVRISGAQKPEGCKNYQFTMTYAPGIGGTDTWRENFVIGDVLPGQHVLKSSHGQTTVEVEAGKITFVNWVGQ
jgi:N-acetylmuramoyl-L-alanine amidase